MGTVPWSSPVADVEITFDLAADLLSGAHPDLADLPLGTRHEGWDNVTYRLGEDLALRLPRRALAAELASREHAWLPGLAREWAFRTPVPVRLGAPTPDYPYAWSIVRWVEGAHAYDEPLTAAGARQLGSALGQLHVPAPPDAPRNPVRSAPLAERAERFDRRLERLLAAGVPVDEESMRQAYAEGAALARPAATWAHLDLHGANVLSLGGALAGILDWGDLGAGDPATDVGQAWCLVGTALRPALLAGYRGTVGALDAHLTARARAEAVAYAATLATLDEDPYRAAGLAALADLGMVQ
ncbi:phosphotransferase [Demequina pelophila]|uniref:phosphotransferase n=1 Tax=Demequina pelophila TaxID=1638984 RepID=UPI0007824449|nr:phosphotransferase [Demequina pelophila]